MKALRPSSFPRPRQSSSPTAEAAEHVLSFWVYYASGKLSTAQVLDFRGAVSLDLKPVGDYARTPTSLELRWAGEEPVQVFVRWLEPGYGPAYLALDNEGKGYAKGGTLHFNAELARAAWRWFDLAYQENLSQREVGFQPSRKLARACDGARRALRRMRGVRQESARAVAAHHALAKTLAAWTALLKEHGRAFARKHRSQFLLGAMLTEPYGDAWQYSVATMFTDYQQRLALMKRQGLDTVGIVFLWREDYTFSRPETFEPYDRVIDEARRLGLKVMAMVLDSFDYKTHQALTDQEFIEASRAQARNLAAHYRGRIRYWTVTDETNGKDFLPHTFAARLKAGNEAARAIKQVDPSSVTLVALLFDDDLLPLLARLKSQQAIAPDVDVIALSLFQHLGPGVDLVYRKIHELFPDKKVGVGESGYTVGKDCDLIYSAPLNYAFSLGGGFWWFHWDSMIDRGIDGEWYTTRFYGELENLSVAISAPAATNPPGPALTRLAGDPVNPSACRAEHDPKTIVTGVGLRNQSEAQSFATPEPLPPHLYEAAAWRGSWWLVESGVFDVETGAVAEAYEAATGRHTSADVSSTAQVLQVFVKNYGRCRDAAYLDAARKAADFLAARAHQGPDSSARGALTEVSGDGTASRATRAGSLTNARAIEALLDFYFATGEEKYLALSEKAADWLLEVMQNAEGSFKAAYDIKTKSFVDGARDDWLHARAFAHARIASALLKVWEGVKETEPRYRDGAVKVLAWALTLQSQNGSFKGHYSPVRWRANDDKDLASLNEGAEGLFSAYAYLLRHPRDIALHPIYFEAFKNYAGWSMRSAQSPEGGIWESILTDDSHGEPATLPTAQAIRAWLRLYLTTRKPEYLDSARRAGDFLVKAQVRGSDRREDGGFPSILSPASPEAKKISSRATAVAVVAHHELFDVLTDHNLVLNPTLPRYTGFDPFF